jgi:hypothetical protein
MSSQNFSKPSPTLTVNSKNDTLITFYLKDAKVILTDLLNKRIVDSLLVEYEKRDSLQDKKITLLIKDKKALEIEKTNKDLQIEDLEKTIKNKDKSAGLDAETISDQKKEIRKQKALKIVFIITTVVLPILTLIATIK